MEKRSFITAPFYKASEALVMIMDKYAPSSSLAAAARRFLLEKNRSALSCLYPSEDPERSAREHFIKKLSLSLMTVFIGFIFFILLLLKGTDADLIRNGALERHESGKGNYDITLDLNADGKEYKNVDVHISERKYSETEISEMLPAFHEALERTFIAGNTDISDISSPVDPVEQVDGYPFNIEWEYSERFCIDADGNIRITPDENGTLIEVSALISYGDFRERYVFPVILMPPKSENAEDFLKIVCEKLDESDKQTATEGQFLLPDEADGIVLTWSEKKKNSALLLFLMSVVAGIVLYRAGDSDINRQMKARDEEMLMDYPEVAGKLALYVGAGMTVRMAWKKTASECSPANASHYAYREMLLTVHEMERGEGELAAYRHFANRCRLQQYVKFVSLLEQNVKLGASGFLSSLRKEAREAQEERKAIAKRRGEEAGTKLLLPMMMMLAIVMAVIIVPAFTGI